MRIIRIDDRLIHGQVIIGWIQNLSIDNVILFEEDLPDYVKDVYRNMLFTVNNFQIVNLLNDFSIDTSVKNVLFIIKDINTLYKYKDKLLKIKPNLINIGGLRTTENKKKILDFVYLSNTDIEQLKEIASIFQIKINARELPYTKEYDIMKLIS